MRRHANAGQALPKKKSKSSAASSVSASRLAGCAC